MGLALSPILEFSKHTKGHKMLTSESNRKPASGGSWGEYCKAVAERDNKRAAADLVSLARVAELSVAGYHIEDMGALYGADWEGQYRWLNASGDWQDQEPVYGVNAAWVLADKHARDAA